MNSCLLFKSKNESFISLDSKLSNLEFSLVIIKFE
jgi:hypothetical protein